MRFTKLQLCRSLSGAVIGTALSAGEFGYDLLQLCRSLSGAVMMIVPPL